MPEQVGWGRGGSPSSRVRLSAALGSGLAGLALGMAGRAPVLAALGAMVGLVVGAVTVSRTDHLPFLSWMLAALTVLDLSLGHPGMSRTAYSLLLWLLALGIGETWCERVRPSGEEITPAQKETVQRRSRRLALGILVLYAVLAFILLAWRFVLFSDRFMPQDTAYFEQGIWGFVEGRSFFQGSSQGWWLYDPPLESHFAMHFSPLLFAVAGLYGVFSSYHLLHAVQIASITLAAWPLYGYVQRESPGRALLVLLAYLLHPAVFSQTQLSFHELALAAPFVSLAAIAWLDGRLGHYLLAMLGAWLAREDLALMAVMGGAVAWLRTEPWPVRLRWSLSSLGFGAVAWMVAGALMKLAGASGGQVILSLFASLGTTPSEIVSHIMRHPGDVLVLMGEDHRPRYLLGLVRPGLGAMLLSPLVWLTVPAVGVNLLVRGAATAWLHVHYSVTLMPILAPAAYSGARSMAAWLEARAGWSRDRTLSTAVSLMVAGSLLGLPDGLSPGMLEAYRSQPDADELRDALGHVPPQAALAAPRQVLHAVARRERLYIVNRCADYTVYDPEYVLVEPHPERIQPLADGTGETYRAYVAWVSTSPRFDRTWAGTHYQLYRDREWRPAPLVGPGDRRPGIPLELKRAWSGGGSGGTPDPPGDLP